MGFLFKIFYSLTALVETLIIFRIIVNLFSFNREHSIVSCIIDTSEIFVSPFYGIVSSTIYFDSFELELTPIVALVFYIVIAFVFSQLAKTFSRTQ